jgi:hypothetical protein
MFSLFLESLNGSSIAITPDNAPELNLLATEFGFASLSSRISTFLCSAEAKLPLLEAQFSQEIASLRSELSHLSGQFSEFSSWTLRTQTTLSQHHSSITALEQRLSAPPFSHPPEFRPQPFSPQFVTVSPKLQPSHFESVIVSKLPPLFSDWESVRFTLLYRGSRDGFGTKDFHRVCDGHSRTLVLIQTPEDYRFGGFTVCVWDSKGKWKRDDRLESFLFTLNNPHGLEPRKFALKMERAHEAIFCGATQLRFGGGPDLIISDKPYTGGFGTTYGNDSGISGEKFFTGVRHFTVKEIEVFEIEGG